MTLARFEKYIDNMVGTLNYSTVCSILKSFKIINTMTVRAIGDLGLSFLTKKKKLLSFFKYFIRKVDSSKQMTA